MSKLIIKASEITNLSDARYFSARAVDYLGFSLDSSSENYIAPIQINAIREWISGPGIVVEMGANIDPKELLQAIELIKPDAVQIGPFFSYHQLPKLEKLSLIRELIPDNLAQLQDYSYEWRSWNNSLAYFLLNLEKNGFSWQLIKNNENALQHLKQLCNEYSVMLSMVFELSELTEIISVLKPFGLSIRGGAEEKVGLKSFEELDDIFDTLEEM
jgi:phosphoribosylanthranilate isomerase